MSDKDKTVFKKTTQGSDATIVRDPSVHNTSEAKNFVNTEPTRFDPRKTAKQVETTRISTAKTNLNTQNENTSSNQQILKDRFYLEKVLGVGGMGVVYKAKDRLKVEAKDRDPYVAIKVLSEEFKSHPEAFISLQRESRKSQRIAHPNTVKVYDFDRDGDTVFMTMEYMEGKPLDQLIRQYKATGLPRDDGWSIINGICSALIHAHAENIVHSDFKPGNVFVTGNSMAKIFDFGIARAVANVDSLESKSGDKTVFDAGNLGALTPAYASLEMLEGEKPDVRDDIYALGCVAYEILTGEHPYKKVPADQAFKQGMKAARIKDINKYQWRAIERALAFKRQDRISTVEEFYSQLTYSYKPGVKSIAAAILLSVMSLTIYFQLKPETQSYSENEIRNELEYKIRLDLFQAEITKLITNPSFSLDWEENIWTEVSGLEKLLGRKDDDWLQTSKSTIYRLYLQKINELIADKKFARTKIMISNAYRYTNVDTELQAASSLLAQAIEESGKQKQLAFDKKRNQEKERIENKKEEERERDIFNLALNNLNQQLQCQSRLNMRDFDIAIKKLRSVDQDRYNKIENKIITSLASCISEIGKLHPERALEAKKYAQRIFRKSPVIASINITPRDACDISIAGLGARGKRATCRDKLQGNKLGPSLVVIPGNKNIKPFALGKYEVSVQEINDYCSLTKTCSLLSSDKDNPATSIPLETAKSYLKWLSKTTRQKYRLPTKHEWIYAATSKRVFRDPNRNCQLNTRGISKGNELVNITTGKQNPWGVVNYLGNAREWVYGDGRKLVAMGGSYKDSMDKCDITLSSFHTGMADEISGFRVLREVKDR